MDLDHPELPDLPKPEPKEMTFNIILTREEGTKLKQIVSRMEPATSPTAVLKWQTRKFIQDNWKPEFGS